jgi:glucosamine 6-phosphate synthetase-like amidotransferase/phosphosugar isomerase protein
VILYVAYILAGLDENIEKLEHLFYNCASIIEEILKDKSKIIEIQEFIGNPVYITFIGSGPSYASAEYGELCFEEVDRIYSSSYKASQFLHGPIEIINNNYRAIVLDLASETREEVDKIICCVTQYDGKVVLITNREVQYNHSNLLKYKINYADSYTSPIIEAIPIQLLAYNIAADKKFDPGKLIRIPK